MFAAVPNDFQDTALNVAHDSIGPELGVPVEVRGDAVLAREVKTDAPWTEGLDAVFAAEDVEVGTADGDVFVECGGRNGFGVYGEGQALLGVPSIHGLDEEDAAFEGGVANASDALL